ncbi:hypothetical protein HY214_02485 [Candidatus Roizmanbacteria bacterium]|nr:hypothetical protein [Candidatus Roizmanbacteria bacterium]
MLKDLNVTLVTIKPVVIEFTSGSADKERARVKREYLDKIVESLLPITEEIYDKAISLVVEYGLAGKDLGVTNFLLGSLLQKYSGNLLLFSRNTNDFLTNLFSVKTIVNMIHKRAIWSYGLYSG